MNDCNNITNLDGIFVAQIIPHGQLHIACIDDTDI
jgi:hypothetical protein